MIENDLKSLRKSHSKSAKVLKDIAAWQSAHEKDNDRKFEAITAAIGELPTTRLITDTIADTIKATVNGKIDKVSAHLAEQDVAIGELSDKIRPFDATKSWLVETSKVILYSGGIAAAVYGMIKLLHFINAIK